MNQMNDTSTAHYRSATPTPPPWPGPNAAPPAAPTAPPSVAPPASGSVWQPPVQQPPVQQPPVPQPPVQQAPVQQPPGRRTSAAPAVIGLVVLLLLIAGVGVRALASDGSGRSDTFGAASDTFDGTDLPDLPDLPDIPDVSTPDLTINTLPPVTAPASAPALSEDLVLKGMDLGWEAIPAEEKPDLCSAVRLEPDLAGDIFLTGIRESANDAGMPLPESLTAERVGEWLQGKCAAV